LTAEVLKAASKAHKELYLLFQCDDLFFHRVCHLRAGVLASLRQFQNFGNLAERQADALGFLDELNLPDALQTKKPVTGVTTDGPRQQAKALPVAKRFA
jgi:hypothetical protein